MKVYIVARSAYFFTDDDGSKMKYILQLKFFTSSETCLDRLLILQTDIPWPKIREKSVGTAELHYSRYPLNS